MSPSGGCTRTPIDQAPGTSEHMAGNDTRSSTLTYAYHDEPSGDPVGPDGCRYRPTGQPKALRGCYPGSATSAFCDG